MGNFCPHRHRGWWQLVTRQGQGHVRTPCCLQWGRCQCRGPNCKKNKKQCCFSCSCFCTKNICHFQELSKHQHNCIASILFLYPSIKTSICYTRSKHQLKAQSHCTLCTKYHKVLNAIVKVENNICVQIKQKRQMVTLWMYLECISARIAKCSQPGFAITEELRLIFPERAGKSWCGWDRNNAKPILRSDPLAEVGKMRTTLETLRFGPMSYREKMRSVTCKRGCRKKFRQNFE